MKIFLGSDHRGYNFKSRITDFLIKEGHDVVDVSLGAPNPDDDFPIFAGKVCNKILSEGDDNSRGLLICGSGQGMCMSANRYKGIRAALGYDVETVESARNDDDANVLCLGADILDSDPSFTILSAFLKTPFAGSTRFKRRIVEMDQL